LADKTQVDLSVSVMIDALMHYEKKKYVKLNLTPIKTSTVLDSIGCPGVNR
jgi:hypothetical protein